MPNMNDSNHEKTMVTNPSWVVSCWAFLTKISGKEPAMLVMRKLISRGVKPESKPYATDTPRDRSMNNALTCNALPMSSYMALTFIIFYMSLMSIRPERTA